MRVCIVKLQDRLSVSCIGLYFYTMISEIVMSWLKRATMWKKVEQMFNQLTIVLIYLTTVARDCVDNGVRL